MGTSQRIKKGGERANSPPEVFTQLCGPGGQSASGKGEPKAAPKKQKAAAVDSLPQPFFCVKSSRVSILAEAGR